MSTVAIVANVGIGPSTYDVLREGDEYLTSRQIDEQEHVVVVDESDIGAAVEAIEEKYGCTLTRNDSGTQVGASGTKPDLSQFGSNKTLWGPL